MTLADDIRNAVSGSGMTINAISAGSGVPKGTLSRFMRKERTITIDTADRLAAYFKLKLVPEDDAKQRRKKKAAG